MCRQTLRVAQCYHSRYFILAYSQLSRQALLPRTRLRPQPHATAILLYSIHHICSLPYTAVIRHTLRWLIHYPAITLITRRLPQVGPRQAWQLGLTLVLCVGNEIVGQLPQL